MKKLNATNFVHAHVNFHVDKCDICIDATAGNGNDTAFLCELVGAGGKVLAFDIQECALAATARTLRQKAAPDVANLILDSHENMDEYAENETVSAIMFNFGYLPGGDHSVHTRAHSSIKAINKGLDLLKDGGIMSLCIYHGGDTGYEERDALLEFLKTIEHTKFTVLKCDFYNRPNDPPIAVIITKSN